MPPTTGRSVAHVQNPVYSDDQASFCFDIASLKHVFGLVLPKVCFSHTPQPRLKHTFERTEPKTCFRRGGGREVEANRNEVNASAEEGLCRASGCRHSGGWYFKDGTWSPDWGVLCRRRDEAFGGKALSPCTKHTE